MNYPPEVPTASDAATWPPPDDATSTAAGAAASTLAELDDLLLGGPRTLTLRDLASRIDAPLDFVRLYWQTLGLPHPEADDVVFTEQDAAAVGRLSRMIREGGFALRTTSSLTRALGHTADRLALWQVEALVEDMATRYGLDDTSARLLVLDRLTDLAPLLEAQLVHAWRVRGIAPGGVDQHVVETGKAFEQAPERRWRGGDFKRHIEQIGIRLKLIMRADAVGIDGDQRHSLALV